MEEVLSYPLGPLSWSLANPDGGWRKTDKSKLACHFKNQLTPANEEMTQPSVYVINSMSLMHTVDGNYHSFGEVANMSRKSDF